MDQETGPLTDGGEATHVVPDALSLPPFSSNPTPLPNLGLQLLVGESGRPRKRAASVASAVHVSTQAHYLAFVVSCGQPLPPALPQSPSKYEPNL